MTAVFIFVTFQPITISVCKQWKSVATAFAAGTAAAAAAAICAAGFCSV